MVIVALTKDQLKKFIEEYFSEYQKLIEPLSPNHKDLFKAYKVFPIKVIAHLSEKGNLWEYIPNSEKFEVEVQEIPEIPEIFPKDKNKHYLYFYLNKYLEKNLDKAKDLAKRSVYDIIADYENYEQYQQELAENYERQYAEYIEDGIKDVVKGYSNYIQSACKAKKQSLETNRNDIFEVVSIIERLREHLIEELLIANCQASFAAMEEIMQDMESALFLAIHGKYPPANALLRRILENSLTALYFDHKINNCCKVGSRTYEAQSKRRDNWVNSSKGRLIFTGDFGVLADLIDPDTDYSALDALKLTKSTVPKTFKAYVEQTYRDLCKYVHYRGLELIDRFSIEFAKFDKKEFEDWISRFKQLIEIYAILITAVFPEVIKKFNKRIGELEPMEQISLLSEQQFDKLFKR